MTATRRAAMFGIVAATASPALAGPVPAPSAIDAALSEYKRLDDVLTAAREREDAACRAYDPMRAAFAFKGGLKSENGSVSGAKQFCSVQNQGLTSG